MGGEHSWSRGAVATHLPRSPAPATIREGWFLVTRRLWPGQALLLQVEQLLYHQHSRYQDVPVFHSKSHGNMLMLDHVTQCTKRDKFSYQEMKTNLLLCSHPSPHKVLIHRGGDRAVLQEVVKHSFLKSIVQCKIDEDVIQVSEKFLPGITTGNSSSKLTLHMGDSLEFMKQNPNPSMLSSLTLQTPWTLLRASSRSPITSSSRWPSRRTESFARASANGRTWTSSRTCSTSAGHSSPW